MTVRRLIKVLQDLAKKDLDMEVEHYDEYRYVPIDAVSLFNDYGYNARTGEWEHKTIIAID